MSARVVWPGHQQAVLWCDLFWDLRCADPEPGVTEPRNARGVDGQWSVHPGSEGAGVAFSQVVATGEDRDPTA